MKIFKGNKKWLISPLALVLLLLLTLTLTNFKVSAQTTTPWTIEKDATDASKLKFYYGDKLKSPLTLDPVTGLISVINANAGAGVKVAEFLSGLASNNNTNYIRVGRTSTTDGATFGYMYNVGSSLAGAFIGNANGSPLLFVNGLGNVGIGTAAPSSKLQLNPPAGVEGLRIISSNYSPFIIRNTANTADLFRVDQNGKVSIGIPTSTSSWATEIGYSTAGPTVLGVTNIDTGAGSYAENVVRNEIIGTGGLGAAMRMMAMGKGYTTLGGFVQDAGVLSSGPDLVGGLSIMTRANSAIRFYTGGYLDANERMRIQADGKVNVSGTFTATTKNFEINHPSKPGYKLVHSSLEGPEVGVYYRGQSQLVGGKVAVALPDYFEALTSEEGRTVQLTANGSEPFVLSASEVKNGKFTAYGTKPDGKFYWEVKAVRKDVPPLVIEKPAEK